MEQKKDDGSWKHSEEIVKYLEEQGVKATFFFNGNNYDCIYSEKAVARVKNVYKKGHQIASHTWRHADLVTLTRPEINEEMEKVEGELSIQSKSREY
ncbi:hypothetical protein MPER_11462 [Moniliophthora perniciosa FA553]|nr:hypothetical protein MPER_11462 [Moniliophthora perniciosa FA553]